MGDQMIRINYDKTDLIFRLLFSLIFLALGTEHLFSDEIIQSMMPEWFVYKRLLSIGAGLVLLTGGFSVMLGYKTQIGATVLGIFVIIVTITIHGTALVAYPSNLPGEWYWLWDVYQRSNFVKNLCLLGVCFHLINHQTGRFSLDQMLSDGTDKVELEGD